MSFRFKVNDNTSIIVRSGPSVSYPAVDMLMGGQHYTGYEYKEDASGTPWIKLDEGRYCCGRENGNSRVSIINSNSAKIVDLTSDIETLATDPDINVQQSPGNTIFSNGISASTYGKISANKYATLDAAIDGSVRLFGLPHQFLPHNDVRISEKSKLGRLFAETTVLEAPSVYFKPGTTKFLPGMSKEEKNSLLNTLASWGTDGAKQAITQRVQGTAGDDPLKYFEHKDAFSDYIRRVNMLARTMAVFLKLDKEPVPWAKGVTFGLYDWRFYKFKSMYVDNVPQLKGEYNKDSHSSVGQFIDDTMQTVHDAIMNDYDYVQFYVDAGSSFSESASNSTQSSVIDQAVTSLEGLSKELYMLSGITGMEGIQEIPNQMASGLDNFIQSTFDGDGQIATFLRRLTGSTKQILSGGNFIIPEVWSDSAYSKSYSITIPLSTPYGNTLSWYINIGVPLAHILAMALPHHLTANTYKMPYLIKAFSPGWFSVELGIIDSISIEKGGSGDAWNSKGLCNEMKITLSIKDLYTSLSVPATYKPAEFMANTGLLEFLMVNCGLDLTQPELSQKLEVLTNMFLGRISDTITQTPYDIIMGFKNFAAGMFKILD